MSENVALQLMEAVKPTGYFGGEAATLLLQLLAWDKLERQGGLPAEASLVGALSKPYLKEQIRQGLDSLRRWPPLGLNAEAFEPDDLLLGRFPESDLYRLVSRVLAAREQDIDYGEVVELCQHLEGRDRLPHLPDEVADLIVRLAGVGPGDEVYCPFEGSLRLAEQSNRVTRNVFLELKRRTPLPFLSNILLDGSVAVHFGDPIREPTWAEGGKLRQFDVTLANPPFGVRYQQEDFFNYHWRFREKTLYGEVLHVRHVLSQTVRRAVVVVPNSILFRTAAGERQFKADLLETGLLEAVIGLPPALLTTTSIPFSLLVLNKGVPADSVLFIDATSEHFFEEKKGRGSLDAGRRTLKGLDEIVRVFERRESGPFSRVASREECEANDYNLLAGRYVASPEQELLGELLEASAVVKLEELADFIRPQSLKAELSEDGVECSEVSVSDIGADGYIRVPQKTVLVNAKSLNRLGQQALKPNDILLAVKGSVGKVGLVPPDFDGVWFANQSFQVLRLRPNPHVADPVVLFRYLSSPAGQTLIESLSGGATVRMIQTRDVRALQVIVPSLEEQAAIAVEHQRIVSLYDEIARLRGEAEGLSRKRWAV